ASGTLTFAPGQTTKTVAVAVVPDKRAEINERFFLHLSAPTGASLAGADGTATIRDDDGPGYLVVGSDGSTYAFGDTIFGATGSLTLHRPIVGAAATPSGNGYWMVASDGGVFSYGDAHFYGSTGNIALNKPIVSITATPTGNGYWMVASDGGVFSYGDAAYYGSTADLLLTNPAAVTPAAPCRDRHP